jgi:hypothetical protein
MSSSDVLRKPNGEPRSDADLDPKSLPPLPMTPTPDPDSSSGSGETSAIDPGPFPLDGLSGSNEEGVPAGSSPFALDPRAVAPDPILGALIDAAPASSSSSDFLVGKPPMAEPAALQFGSFEALRALNLDAQDRGRSAPSSQSTPAAKSRGKDDEEEEVIYLSGPNWPMLILGSYASAVTLALVWWVILPRLRGQGEPERFTPAAPVAVGTRRPDLSRKVDPIAPIPPEQITQLGQPLRLGSLEITPLSTARQGVRLRRVSLTGKAEVRDGGSGALALRVRLRNVSDDAIFAPLEKAFLRDSDTELTESFVELPQPDRVYLYPLPVESEWSIVGQDFPVLRPGEAKETTIVTAADFPETGSPMTWRLTVRTGPGKVETVGVAIPSSEGDDL